VTYAVKHAARLLLPGAQTLHIYCMV